MENVELNAIVKRLATYGKLIYYILCNLKLTRKQKMLLGVGLGYLLSPIDLIPGFIPVLGQLDDIIVTLTVLIKILKELAPETRKAYLDKFALTLEMIESDLAYVKHIAADIARKTASSAGRVISFGGKTALHLAVKGLSGVLRGAASLAASKSKHKF